MAAEVTGSELQHVYDVHKRIVGETGHFKWLLDGHMHPDATVHPVNSTDSRILRLNSNGSVVVCISSHKKVLLNDYALYEGSYKDWISPVVAFPIFNPVKKYRMVSFKIGFS